MVRSRWLGVGQLPKASDWLKRRFLSFPNFLLPSSFFLLVAAFCLVGLYVLHAARGWARAWRRW